MKPRTITMALALLVLGAIFLAASAAAEDSDGKAVFLAQKCDLCHSVSSAGIEATTKSEKLKGPDLTGVGDRHDGEWIGKFIKKEVDKDGKLHTKPFKGSDEELKALVDWLLEQK